MRDLNDIEKRIVAVSVPFLQPHWWDDSQESGISKEIAGTFAEPVSKDFIAAATLIVLQFVPLDKAAQLVDALESEFNKDMPGVLKALSWQLQKLRAIEAKKK